MSLVKVKSIATFDLTQIKTGDLIWAKHKSWAEGKAGFVTSAKSEQLIAQYHPGIGNVTNHFIISVSEVTKKEWEIKWSENLTEIKVLGEVENDEP